MNRAKGLLIAGMLTLGMVIPASAEDGFSAQGALAIAKMAGACGILDSLIRFQASTRMPGGEDFVARFWGVEAARLGMTTEQLSAKCDDSIGAYNRIWDAVEGSY